MKYLLLVAIVAALLFMGCVKTPPAQNQSDNETPPNPPEDNGTGMANPASVNCVEKGYTLEIRKDATGGEIGYCKFPNGRECEEWAFFRGNCDETRPIIAQEGETCAGIAAIQCADGLECTGVESYPDAGGTCTKPVPSLFTTCPIERGEICTTQYDPVCGRSGTDESTYGYETYSNSCVACSKSSPVTIYARGTCESLNLTKKPRERGVLYDCPSERHDACTKEYDPVCGRLVGGGTEVAGYRDFGNPCEACSVRSNAIGYYIGTCAEQ